jgi:hypothetical protein
VDVTLRRALEQAPAVTMVKLTAIAIAQTDPDRT